MAGVFNEWMNSTAHPFDPLYPYPLTHFTPTPLTTFTPTPLTHFIWCNNNNGGGGGGGCAEVIFQDPDQNSMTFCFLTKTQLNDCIFICILKSKFPNIFDRKTQIIYSGCLVSCTRCSSV